MRRFHMLASARLPVAALSFLLVSACPPPPSNFTIVLIPDTQNYHEGSGGFEPDQVTQCTTALAMQTTLTCQLQWIVENRQTSNIRVAIHLGDISDANGDNDDGFRAWEAISDAYKTLDRAGLPYSVVPGNHDHRREDIGGASVLLRDVRHFEWLFPPARFSPTWYVDSFPKQPRANRNNAIQFTAGDDQFLVISLDMAPEKDAVCWADSLARALPRYHLIVATHCYKAKGAPRPDGTREAKHQSCTIGYNIVGMDGVDLWNELLALHSNIVLAVSGHIQGGVGYNTRPSLAATQPVHEVLVDYQDDKFAGRKHGAGWMRTLEIDPGAGRLKSRPVSVLGRTAFNAKVTSDVCEGSSRPLCYENDPAHKDHSFDTTFVLPNGPATHVEPASFTDRVLNGAAEGDHSQSSLAMTPTGDFVAAWSDDSEAPAGSNEIFARSFRRDGCARGPDYRANLNSRRQQLEPDIGTDDAGRVVIAWSDDSRGTANKYQIYARGLTADGRQTFYPRTVNQVASGDQRTPRVAVAPDGRFFVAWHDTRSDAGDIFMRGYAADGQPLFDEVRVNSSTSGKQDQPDIATNQLGEMVVVWRRGSEIQFRAFHPDGTPFGAVQTVANVSNAAAPSVAAAPDGQAAVAWRHGTKAIRMRRFTIGGASLGAATTVKVAPHGQVDVPAIEISSTHEVIVVWQDDTDNNDSWQIHSQAFLADGTALGPETVVNKNSRGQQKDPSIAARSAPDGTGRNLRWVIAWTDDLDKDGKRSILGRGGLFRLDQNGRPLPTP